MPEPPHKASDPVIAACHMVLAMQSIVSRNLDPLDAGVITIGIIQAGSAPNIIPDQAIIRGSIRSFTKEDREMIFRRIGEIAQNVGPGPGGGGRGRDIPRRDPLRKRPPWRPSGCSGPQPKSAAGKTLSGTSPAPAPRTSPFSRTGFPARWFAWAAATKPRALNTRPTPPGSTWMSESCPWEWSFFSQLSRITWPAKPSS